MARDRRPTISHPTWRMALTEAATLTAAQAAALELIAQLPLAPIEHLVPLAGTSDRSALYRQVTRLAQRGLVATFDGPAHGRCRPRQLLLPTNLGLAVLASCHAVDPRALGRRCGLGRGAIGALIRQLPAVLSSYELLSLLAGSRRGLRARLLAWHRPWLSPGSANRDATGPARGARLPAYASLEWHAENGQRLAGGYVLLADTGGLPPLALRSPLARLARIQLTTGRATPVVAIATTSRRRVEAWSAVLDGIAASAGCGSLEACVHSWNCWKAGGVVLPWTTRSEAQARYGPALMFPRPDQQRPPWSSVPRPIPLARVRAAVMEWHLSEGGRVALDIIGRHPFLPTVALGEVLGRDTRWARERRTELVRRGLMRVLAPEEMPPNLDHQDELLEATTRGLTMLAGSMGLPLAVAVRHHGLAGGGPATAVGPRRALLAHLTHTCGADQVFVTIARLARGQRDGALLEWRNAAACARGRMRPDGYGLLRLGHREYGFFLEFDRGTVHPAALRAKFAAYHRYRASARAARDYDGFPTILVITTGPGGEQRIVDVVVAVSTACAAPLQVFVTTTEWIAAEADGILGRIWLRPGRTGRLRFPSEPDGIGRARVRSAGGPDGSGT
jgi:hypothetical protein